MTGIGFGIGIGVGVGVGVGVGDCRAPAGTPLEAVTAMKAAAMNRR
jgi:hypothetical protein